MPRRKPITLLADMVHSRQSSQRQAVYRLVQTFLRKSGKGWLGKPATRGGIDELTAVPATLTQAWSFMVQLNDLVWPDRYRFAIADGDIDVGLSSGNALKMDGPAFHAAARELQRAERDELTLAIGFSSEDGAHTRGVVEMAATMRQQLISGWTPLMHRTFRSLQATPSVKKTAAAHNISVQAVYQTARRGHFDLITKTSRSIADWFDAVDRERTP